MSCPGCCFNFETSAARSPLIKCELFHASFFKVLDATNFGMLLNWSANPSGSFRPGQAAANPSYVTRPRRSASEARVSSSLNFWVSSLQNGKLHFSGDSTTPSSDTNRVAAKVRVPGNRFTSVRATEGQYFSLRGGAERQGHESELDEETTVGAALEPIPEGRAGSPPALRRVITLRHAVAIYVSSLLGSGIFVIPGLAARIAGPASIVSWMLLSLASYPFAYTFAKLSAKRPESGGIYAFARDGIGLSAGAATAWLFLAWAVLGAPAATVAAASYLAFVFPFTRLDIYLAAASILILAFVVNYVGIRFTGRVQLATVAAILVALVIAVVASAPRVRPANYTPFLPSGLGSIGTAAALIVWSYLGYENTSNVAEEFRNPERDFHRSVVISVFLISGLYLAIAVVTVGTGAYTARGGVTPFAAMMSDAFGSYGGAIVALLAVFVTFGTVNAYVAGMARVYYAAARDGVFPKTLAVVDRRTGVPHHSLVFLIILVLLSLSAFYVLNVDFVSAFLMASGAAVFTYVIGSAAGIRLLKERGWRRALPWISLAVAVLPFIGTLLVASVVIAGAGLLASWAVSRPRRGATGGI